EFGHHDSGRLPSFRTPNGAFKTGPIDPSSTLIQVSVKFEDLCLLETSPGLDLVALHFRADKRRPFATTYFADADVAIQPHEPSVGPQPDGILSRFLRRRRARRPQGEGRRAGSSPCGIWRLLAALGKYEEPSGIRTNSEKVQPTSPLVNRLMNS